MKFIFFIQDELRSFKIMVSWCASVVNSQYFRNYWVLNFQSIYLVYKLLVCWRIIVKNFIDILYVLIKTSNGRKKKDLKYNNFLLNQKYTNFKKNYFKKEKIIFLEGTGK